jgi:multiple sugar transport system permease protein
MFVVLLVAIESQPQDQREAALVDGASRWQVFRYVTWPAILPVSVTVLLIRAIEAFKIIDLPNVLTNGGPGIASESMTLHAFVAWRALDLGGSAAIAYMLLFLVTFVCLSMVAFVRPAEREARL